MEFKVFRSLGRDVKRVSRMYKDIWFSKITSAVAELISMRMALGGKAHEGEFGLAIAKFVRETFKSVGVMLRINKLSKTNIGKMFIAYTLLDVVK